MMIKTQKIGVAVFIRLAHIIDKEYISYQNQPTQWWLYQVIAVASMPKGLSSQAGMISGHIGKQLERKQ